MTWSRPAQHPVLLSAALLALLSLGCGGPETPASTSSGSIVQKRQLQWPAGVPRRVAVLPLEGNRELNTQATDLMSTELLRIGFDVIERGKLGAVISELKLSNSGLIDDSTRRKLGSILGVEAVFIGNITGSEKVYKFGTHLNIKFITVENGKVLWAADTTDKGIHMAEMHASYVYAVKEAVKLLKKDLDLNWE